MANECGGEIDRVCGRWGGRVGDFVAFRELMLVAGLVAATAAGGCTRSADAPTSGPAAGGAAQSAPADSAGSQGQRLDIYIWSAYLPQDVLDDFTKRTGIPVNVDLYDSNEALLEKLQSGAADYDVVVPSDYMVRILAGEKLIQRLDHTRLRNLGNLDPRFLDQAFDPNNQYSLPYFWGTTGFGYNKKKIGKVLDSWQAVFDPTYKGRILMLDDMRECFAAALKSMGRSLNEEDPAVLEQAAELLKKQKKLVQAYDSADFAVLLAAGNVDIAHGYNGQLAAVVRQQPNELAYVVPKEGATLWLDNVAIPAAARNLDAAYVFLDFVMDPEVNARIVNAASYASANVPARKLIDPRILADPAIYPSDDVIARCELLADLGDTTTALDQYWTEIKAH